MESRGAEGVSFIETQPAEFYWPLGYGQILVTWLWVTRRPNGPKVLYVSPDIDKAIGVTFAEGPHDSFLHLCC